MPSPNEIRKGTVVNLNGELWFVVEFQRVSPGKGSSFVRTRAKNLQTGKVIEHVFKSAETLTFEDVSYKKMQFLYESGMLYTFMDNQTYEQVELDQDQIGNEKKFLKENLEVTVIMHGQTPLTIELPKKISYTVTSAPPAVKGDTASGNVTKEVELDNGLKIQTPVFIREGDQIMVNTETSSYSERINE
ncbi:elongation factor P [Candidatus Uhrbacteria bacterium CG_4_9_14_3_um_filter_36_7]|uniref:Elongation factor P n=1 Tax=Candidatus Uhrbacteria bacterium CG_4_9_14_3_um_filter_36_7 TaxID=1975033 RepID=A0A2M7XHD9_9BACT|nr:MAG: elongation factor P [Candidatus Uhrbacteria bacterium CG_4_9_14_3_um_filter_36_7]